MLRRACAASLLQRRLAAAIAATSGANASILLTTSDLMEPRARKRGGARPALAAGVALTFGSLPSPRRAPPAGSPLSASAASLPFAGGGDTAAAAAAGRGCKGGAGRPSGVRGAPPPNTPAAGYAAGIATVEAAEEEAAGVLAEYEAAKEMAAAEHEAALQQRWVTMLTDLQRNRHVAARISADRLAVLAAFRPANPTTDGGGTPAVAEPGIERLLQLLMSHARRWLVASARAAHASSSGFGGLPPPLSSSPPSPASLRWPVVCGLLTLGDFEEDAQDEPAALSGGDREW